MTTYKIPSGGKLANVSHGATADLNDLYAAVAAIGGFNILDQQFAGGADNTGVNDSKNAFQDAINKLPASGGIVYIPAGTYKIASTVTIPRGQVYLIGPGKWAATVNYTGSGDCFRMYSSVGYSVGGSGGGFLGFTIDGTGAAAGACGIHAGDMLQLQLDVVIRKFQGSGSKGLWLDNNYFWAEQLTGRVYVKECTDHVVFDNSVDTSGTSTGSFVRMVFDIYLDMKNVGNGVTFKNGASQMGGRLGIYGNIDYGSTLRYVLILTGNSASSGFSRIYDGTLNIDVECNATVGTQPATIKFNTVGSNGIFRCTGNINFAGNNPFAQASTTDSSFQFDGPIMGDAALFRTSGLGTHPYEQGVIANGDTLHTRYNSVLRCLPPNGGVTGLKLSVGSVGGQAVTQTLTIINDGTGPMLFAASGTSNLAVGSTGPIMPGSAASYIYDMDNLNWVRTDGSSINEFRLSASGDSTGVKDTLNIQTLLNAAPQGGAVVLQAGLYRTNNELVIPPFVELRGPHGNRTDNIQVFATIKPVNSFSGTACIHLKDQEEGGYSTQNDGVRISNLVLDGSALSNGSGIEGIKATGLVHGVVIDRVTTQQFPSYGVGCHTYTRIDTSVKHPYSWNLWNCMGWQNKDHAFFFGNQQTDCTFTNCEALGNVGDGFYFVAAQNTQLIGCRSEFNLNGFNIQGSWGTTTASGGILMSGCSTDRNTQHGVRIESTGNGVHTIECQTRRDGRNSNSGGGGFAGIFVNSCTNPVNIPYATCYPGVDDDGSGTSSPDYGVYVAGSTWVSVASGYLHAAVAGWKDGGSNTTLLRGANIGIATGSTSSPTRDALVVPPWAGSIFGNGSDGALVFNGSSTVAGMVPSSNVYTMTRDIYATDITINNGVTLKPANFRIFCRGTLSNAGTISAIGNAGAAAGTAGGSMGSGTLVGGRAGGAGTTGTGGAGSAAFIGMPAGGAGGAGNPGAAGAGGTIVNSTVMPYQLVFPVLSLNTSFNFNQNPPMGGPGGGAGGGDGTNNGGGGGSGGGIIVIIAYKVVNTGTISVKGGAGGTPTAGNTGGGGSGSGGVILIYTLVAWTAGTTDVTAGSAGSLHGTGSNGVAGGSGTVLNVVLA